MKKIRILLMIALMLVSACSGCTDNRAKNADSLISGNYPTDNVYHADTDCAYYAPTTFAATAVAETESGYYFLVSDILLYADSDTMKPIPVCSKPHCRHHLETDDQKKKDCNAYFPLSLAVSNVFYADNQLYVFHSMFGLSEHEEDSGMFDYALTRINPDGTQRRILLEIECEFPNMVCMHRGRLYLAMQTANEQGLSVCELWSYSVTDPSETPVLLYRTEAIDTLSNITADLFAYGNYLYLKEMVSRDNTKSVHAVRVLDLNNREWYVIENPEGYRTSQIAISDNRLLCTYSRLNSESVYFAGEKQPDPEILLLARELDGTAPQEIAVGPFGELNADAAYCYIMSAISYEQQTDGTLVSSIPTASYYFYDQDMNLIDELPFECLAREGATLGSCTIHPMCGDKYLLHTRYGGNFVFCWFDRDQIGTGEITPVEFLSYEWNTFQFINN